MLKKLLIKSKQGFTLIEMMVTVAVTAIFMLGVVSTMPIISGMLLNNLETSYARSMASSVAEAVCGQLYYGPVTMCTNSQITYINQGGAEITIPNSRGNIEGIAYHPKYFIQKNYELRFQTLENNAYKVIVTIYTPERGKIYSTERIVAPLNQPKES